MMRILPAVCGCVLSGELRRGTVVSSDTASSDMDCLPGRYQWKIQSKSRALAWAALHTDAACVFLDDAVGDRESKTGAARLTFRGSSLSGEKWIVDALNVLLCNARAGVGDAHTDEFAVTGRDVEHSAARRCHGILGIQKQIQKHLLQASSVTLNQRQVLVKLGLHLNLRHTELVLEQRQRIRDDLVQADFGQFGAGGAGEVQQVVHDL